MNSLTCCGDWEIIGEGETWASEGPGPAGAIIWMQKYNTTDLCVQV